VVETRLSDSSGCATQNRALSTRRAGVREWFPVMAQQEGPAAVTVDSGGLGSCQLTCTHCLVQKSADQTGTIWQSQCALRSAHMAMTLAVQRTGMAMTQLLSLMLTCDCRKSFSSMFSMYGHIASTGLTRTTHCPHVTLLRQSSTTSGQHVEGVRAKCRRSTATGSLGFLQSAVCCELYAGKLYGTGAYFSR
jgi:hypothetical protein